jgi:GntR family transcriptional regulator/MocR family aminotransferase
MKRVSSTVLPIISIDRKLSRPLHRQVYEAYRAAILERTLRAGQRVPSSRMLASELGISRIPVLAAYAQLIAEGYFQSRVGAGTVVSPSLSDQVALSAPSKHRSTDGRTSSCSLPKCISLPDSLKTGVWQRERGAFCLSQVPFDEFPHTIWRGLVTRHRRNTSPRLFNYGDPMGSKELRQAIAVYLRTARGVRCDPDQIMIVTGSQQALDVAVRALLNPGDRVWMEEPGYKFARSVFALNHCPIVPVPVDDEGLNVGAGIKRCAKARAALVTPSHQYPLGVTMSASRRLQLLDWAESSGSWILEDDYDSEYRYENMPIGSLQGLDRSARVVYIGTFSKVLFPSLRLGYLVIPRDLVERFLAVRFAMDIGSPSFYQAVLADFIREGHFSRHLRRTRLLYSERRIVLIHSINKYLGFEAEVMGAQAGMHLALMLNGINDRQVAERAAQQKLWLAPLSPSYIEHPPRQGFILGFGSTIAEEIPKAMRSLRTIMALGG